MTGRGASAKEAARRISSRFPADRSPEEHIRMSLDPARFAPMANAIRALTMDAVQAGQYRPSGHADGHGRCRHRAVVRLSEVRSGRNPTGPTATASCCRPGTARCCFTALLHLTGYEAADDRGYPQFPPARQPLRRSPGELPARRRRGDHRSAGPGAGDGGRHGDGRAPPQRRLRRPIWSITAPG